MAITTTRYAIFNSYNFNSVSGLSVYSVTPPGANNARSLNIFPLARRSAQKLSSAFYQKNSIEVGIYLTAASREQLESALDTLLTNIQGQEGSLVVPISGGTARSYTCTYDHYVINNKLSASNNFPGFADITLVFITSDSFGYDQFFTPMIGPTANLNSTPNTFNWTFKGSADTQVPVLQFYFNGGTLGSATVTIGNNATGQQIQITRTWSVGDTLKIDTQNRTVQVNGVNVQFSGAFPEFALGLGTITYADTFTSRQYQFYSYVYYRWV